MVGPTTIQHTIKLRTDERGSVTILFGLCLFLVILFVGCAIDYGRAVHANQRLGIAVDVAAIAAAKAMRDGTFTVAEAKVVARKYFDENMPRSAGAYTTISGWDPQIDAVNKSVTVSATGQVQTLFAKLAGYQTISFPKQATAAYEKLDIEVALQLDMTGSMNDPDTKGKQKMAGLKDATNLLLDTLINGSAGTNKVRIGFAPFAAGVNAGAYANAVAGGRATNGCVYERRSAAYDATDVIPSGLDDLKAKSDLTPALGYTLQDCPVKPKVIALTDNKAALKLAVQDFTPNGSTAGQLGTAWGWYLLSPTWASIWPSTSTPAAYGDKKTVKALVLMTDGIYNTVGGINKGDFSSTATDAQTRARALCDLIKAQKITIYTVGFIKPTDPASATDTLKYCASAPAYFYPAEDAEQLSQAFKTIASDISKLRLSK
jgi:Flp pilus assembly protein TadG